MSYTPKKLAKTKPVFNTIDQIRPGVHCYNIYGVITELSIETTTTNRGDQYNIAKGVITDHTGSANFLLKGDHTKLLKKDGTFAFRNGKSMVINEHIQLEMDKFGKVSAEEVEVKADTTQTNISDECYERKPRA